MSARRLPSDDDYVDVRRQVLAGLRADVPFAELARTIEPFHPPGNTFPGEVLLELGADALETAGVSREHPLHLEGLRERLLPEDAAGSQAAR